MRRFGNIFFFLAALVIFSAGCGKRALHHPGEGHAHEALAASRSPITGVVKDSAAIAYAAIELRLVRSRPAPADTTVKTTADAEGRFSIIPFEAGPYELVAHLPLEPNATYTAFVADRPQETVVISPLSTIAAGFVRYELRSENFLDEAIATGVTALSAHLHVPHLNRVEPAAWPLAAPADAFDAAVQAQLVVQGLARIANGFVDPRQDVPAPPSVARLSHVLAEDLAADGILDGRGAEAARLTFAGSGYDGSLLRAQLAQHMLDTVDTLPPPAHKGRSRRELYCETAQGIVHSAQPAIGQPHFPQHFSCQIQHLIIDGRVPFMDTDAPWQVDAWSVDPTGAMTQRRADANVDPINQRFSLDIFGDTGPLLVRAYPKGHDASYFFSFLLPPELEKATVKTNLNPLSTISAAYTQGLLRQQPQPLTEALEQAAHTLNEHFGTNVHAPDVASDFDVQAWLTADAPLDSRDRAGLLCIAMGHLADVRSGFAVDRPFRRQRLLQLTWLLAEDVSADARFDGSGGTRRSLALEGYPIGGSTIRADLGRSILSYVYSAHTSLNPEHTTYSTSTSTQEAQGWARSLAATTQAPFPATFDAITSQGPSLSGHCVVRDGATRYPLSDVLRGVVCVECAVPAGHFLANANITLQVADQAVSADDNIISPGPNRDNRTMLSFLIDTRKLSMLGGSQTAATLTIDATDTLGNSASTPFDLQVDNTKPTITCSTCEQSGCSDGRNNMWIPRNESLQASIQVTGLPPFEVTAKDTNLKVTLSTESGVDNIIGNNIIVRTYHITGERAATEQCATCPINIVVTDGVGNQSHFTLLARWSDNGPSFAKNAITFLAFDQFQNNDVQAPHITPAHSLNIVSHRYASNLDHDPEHGMPPVNAPLPELRINLNPDDANALPAQSVDYRATPYSDTNFATPIFLESTPWRAAFSSEKEHPSTYFLPLAFQTLLPPDTLANREQARDLTRMLIHNQEANGPAAWKIEVRATDHYGNSSFRDAFVVFDIKLPPVHLQHAPKNTGWCSYNVTQAAQHPHQDVAVADLQWPMHQSAHSLFRRPDLQVTITYPVPPVTYVDKTEWYIQPTGKPKLSFTNKRHKASWENLKALECESRTGGGIWGIWVQQGDHCIEFDDETYYDALILPGSKFIPLPEEKRRWITTEPPIPVTYSLYSRAEQIKSLTAQIGTHSYFSAPTSIHTAGVQNNLRARLSDCKVLVYGNDIREERWLHEYVVAASTKGKIRWDFEVAHPFLRLNMTENFIVKDISCQLQPPPPWQMFSWEHTMHGMPANMHVPTAEHGRLPVR